MQFSYVFSELGTVLREVLEAELLCGAPPRERPSLRAARVISSARRRARLPKRPVARRLGRQGLVATSVVSPSSKVTGQSTAPCRLTSPMSTPNGCGARR